MSVFDDMRYVGYIPLETTLTASRPEPVVATVARRRQLSSHHETEYLP